MYADKPSWTTPALIERGMVDCPSLMTVILVPGRIQLISLGVIGEHIDNVDIH